MTAMTKILKGLFGAKTSKAAVIGTTAIFSGVPQKAMEVVYDRLTAKVIIGASAWYFSELCAHLEQNSFKQLSNTLVLGGNGKASIGYGTSWSKFSDSLVKVIREKDKEEKITITFFLTSKEDAVDKLDEFIKGLKGDTKAYVYHKRIDILKLEGKDINYVKTDYVRKEESVFLDKKVLGYINKRIDEFLSRKTWYVDRGIPYKYAILLHGPPGTGKTTIAKYIAGRLERALIIANPMDIALHTSSLSRCVALMEDIDCDMSTLSRGPEGKGQSFMLGDLLNSIDGVNSAEDCIIIGTTNHLKKIDPALLRKGRFDDVIEIKALETTEIVRMVKFFFDDQDLTGFMKYRPIVGAVVQDIIMNNFSEGPQKVIEVLNKKYAKKPA